SPGTADDPEGVAPVGIVGVQPGHQVAAAVGHAGVDRRRLPPVRLTLPVGQPGREPPNDGHAVIGRTAVHDHDFKMRIALVENTGQRLGQEVALVERRYDHADLRQTRSRYTHDRPFAGRSEEADAAPCEGRQSEAVWQRRGTGRTPLYALRRSASSASRRDGLTARGRAAVPLFMVGLILSGIQPPSPLYSGERGRG